jgi:hypothetical protein
MTTLLVFDIMRTWQDTSMLPATIAFSTKIITITFLTDNIFAFKITMEFFSATIK